MDGTRSLQVYPDRHHECNLWSRSCRVGLPIPIVGSIVRRIVHDLYGHAGIRSPIPRIVRIVGCWLEICWDPVDRFYRVEDRYIDEYA